MTTKLRTFAEVFHSFTIYYVQIAFKKIIDHCQGQETAATEEEGAATGQQQQGGLGPVQ